MIKKKIQNLFISFIIISSVSSDIYEAELDPKLRPNPIELSCPIDKQLDIKSARVKGVCIPFLWNSYCPENDETEFYRKACNEKNYCGLVPTQKISDRHIRIEYSCVQCVKEKLYNSGYCKNVKFQLIKRDIERSCSASRVKRHDDNHDPAFRFNLAALIALYRSLASVIVLPIRDPGNAITETASMGVRLDNGGIIRVPAFLRATIRRNHLQSSSTRYLASDVPQQMTNMNIRNGDERGHLLSNKLGGNGEVLNIVPMARAVNRHSHEGDRDRKPTLNEFSNALSRWRNDEDRMQRFLEADRGRRIDWTLAVVYDDAVMQFNFQGQRNLRPTHFIVQFVLYNADGTVADQTGEIVYINSNDLYCPWTEYRD